MQERDPFVHTVECAVSVGWTVGRASTGNHPAFFSSGGGAYVDAGDRTGRDGHVDLRITWIFGSWRRSERKADEFVSATGPILTEQYCEEVLCDQESGPPTSGFT
jgi:hypothetical protein